MLARSTGPVREAIWTAQFDRAGDIVGRAVRMNGEPATIVGVMPSWFGFPHSASLWLPLALDVPPKRGDGMRVEGFGRLRDGISIAQANAEVAAIAARLEQQHPENRNRTAAAIPLMRRLLPMRMFALLTTMLAAVLGVLLIACVNVANLQLARLVDRAKDVAIRLALGASRARIVRELLFEGILLAVAGALLGVALAHVGVDAVTRGIDDPSKPFWIVFQIDRPVLLFTLALTIVSALVSSVVPALRVTGAALAPALNDDSRTATSRRGERFSRGLVVAQIALSFALLLPSGLMIRSIAGITAVSFPFRTDVLAARLDLSAYKDDAALRGVLDRIAARVAATPGVAGWAFANRLPGMAPMGAITIEGREEPQGSPVRAEILQVAPSYFRVMGLGVARGRPFEATDRAGSELVAIVSEDFVAQHLAGQDAVGRRIQIGTPYKAVGWRTIVGVVPALPNVTRDTGMTATVLVPLDQTPTRLLDVIAAGGSGAAVPPMSVRKAVAEIDPRIAVSDVATVQNRFDQRTWPFRVFGGLFSVFGFAALLLAGAGLYGVMASAVGRRTGEIGIRMALGADRPGILRMVLREGARLVTIGVVLGGAVGILLASQLSNLLFRVEPWDPVVLATTLAVLCGAGALASFVPARRAASVDPLVALRR